MPGMYSPKSTLESGLVGGVGTELITIRSTYCGLPSGMEAFRVADRVLNEMAEKGEITRE